MSSLVNKPQNDAPECAVELSAAENQTMPLWGNRDLLLHIRNCGEVSDQPLNPSHKRRRTNLER